MTDSPSLFLPAVREARHARVALSGPSGSGKTYTALLIAHQLGERIAVIDTERRSAGTYVGVNGWSFDHHAPPFFAPGSLTQLLGDAAESGHDVVVVDSLTQYWSGPDGMLELADSLKTRNDVRSGWNEARPIERQMFNALATYPGHVIVTHRVKTEHVVDVAEDGRKVARVIGLKPEQRDGIEYEFDIVADLDEQHHLQVTKSRVPEVPAGRYPDAASPAFTGALTTWCADGVRVDSPTEVRDRVLNTDDPEVVNAAGFYITQHGLTEAPVRDQHGETVRLIDLVIARHQQMQRAAAARQNGPTP
ncbi:MULTISPECIES: AAA family ATPase [unclassified Aeromicrobium]|uniref:AAA family ATPase n=1 Tax=unclassified Aeromicrobium TaxID=2633570 RepID=UPI00288B95EA|nr:MULTISPECIES: AAA family ATPase [unclassified Aeromicrobium]